VKQLSPQHLTLLQRATQARGVLRQIDLAGVSDEAREKISVACGLLTSGAKARTRRTHSNAAAENLLSVTR
jgi:hypothetical protein